ncbi:MAG: asparagine synthase-related protein [Nitrospiraceae bacterium]|nr:asparagine synthase-related protein [Nitrospiraceae bacterium]
MPGIAGFVGTGFGAENSTALQRMIGSMLHEPFYASGSYGNAALGLWAGAVCDTGEFADCVPAWNETKDVCLIFSGEVYPDPSEISGLTIRGHLFDPDTAGYLVHLYEDQGLAFIGKLNGRFSGVLVDLRTRTAVLFNDRYGLGRIYYHQNEKGLFFASEAKAILAVLPELRSVDPAGLAETFSCGCVLQNRTLFAGVSLLPPGSRWILAGKREIVKERYFDPGTWETLPHLSAAEYTARLQETFSRILPRYFKGRRRIAMSLTGGLDGRMIMAWAGRFANGLPCYTFGSSYRDCNDVKIARRVASLCRQPHETIVVDTQFFSRFPVLAEKAVSVSDGTMDVTGAVELYVNERARQIAPVRLTGNYGSEIVRGNVAFRPGRLDTAVLAPEFAGLLPGARDTYYRERQDGHPLSFIAFKQVPWHHYSRLSVELSQLTPRSPYLDNELVELMYQAPAGLVVSKEPSLRVIARGNADLSAIATDRGVRYRPVPVLSKLGSLFQEFTFKAEYAYDYGMPPWLSAIDHALATLHLERAFLGRHKFYHFRVWYRDRLTKYVKEILLDPRTRSRPYVNGRALETMVTAHTEGRGNYTSEIHRLLTSELFHRQLIDSR